MKYVVIMMKVLIEVVVQYFKYVLIGIKLQNDVQTCLSFAFIADVCCLFSLNSLSTELKSLVYKGMLSFSLSLSLFRIQARI